MRAGSLVVVMAAMIAFVAALFWLGWHPTTFAVGTWMLLEITIAWWRRSRSR